MLVATTLPVCNPWRGVLFTDIKLWMRHNRLQLNDDKTEVLVLHSPYYCDKINIPYIHVGDSDVLVTPKARNLGVKDDT